MVMRKGDSRGTDSQLAKQSSPLDIMTDGIEESPLPMQANVEFLCLSLRAEYEIIASRNVRGWYRR